MINEFNPKISIIIPVYNGSDYLKDAINSALSQTYENFEVLVINDGSTDDGKTEAVAKSYGDKITYYYKENGGVSSALNLGIKMMTGEYFSWLSHDDKYTPYKLANLVNLLKNDDTKNTIAMTSVTHIDSNGSKIKELKHDFEHSRIYTGEEVLAYMTTHITLNGCAMIIPKRAFDICGGFNEDLRYNQDGLMWYLIFHNNFNLIVDVHHSDVMYRLHPQQTSKTRRDLLLRDSLELTKIFGPMLISHANGRELLRNFAKRYAIHDCRAAVNECIKIGRKEKKFNIFDWLMLKLYIIYGIFRQFAKKVYIHLRFS